MTGRPLSASAFRRWRSLATVAISISPATVTMAHPGSRRTRIVRPAFMTAHRPAPAQSHAAAAHTHLITSASLFNECRARTLMAEIGSAWRPDAELRGLPGPPTRARRCRRSSRRARSPGPPDGLGCRDRVGGSRRAPTAVATCGAAPTPAKASGAMRASAASSAVSGSSVPGWVAQDDKVGGGSSCPGQFLDRRVHAEVLDPPPVAGQGDTEDH